MTRDEQIAQLKPGDAPKPKAVPGVRYRKKDVIFSSVRVGHVSGQLFTPDPLVASFIDFDPTVWTPIDDVKVGE